MIVKTEGIILRTFRHDENNLIARVYTREMGARSFMLKGFRSATGNRKYSYFQPLSVVEMVFLFRENRDMHRVNESRPAFLLRDAQTNPMKLPLGLTMAEIFYDCVREEETNTPLYDFLREAIRALDESEQKHIHDFLRFLLHLTGHLGFLPADASGDSQYARFDFRTGKFSATPTHSDLAGPLLRRFLYSDWHTCRDIAFDGQEKRLLLNTLFEYYRLHINGFRYPQTIRVFAEVFG